MLDLICLQNLHLFKMEADLVTNRLMAITHPQKHSTNNLYEHLTKLVTQLPQFQKEKIAPIANLEYISQYIKNYQFRPQSPPTEQQLLQLLNMKIQYPLWLQQQEILKNKSCIQPKDKLIVNFQLQHQKLFNQISIGFGREEACLIHAAIKRLVEDKKGEKIRFWGKILTQGQDYYIAQGFTKQTTNDPPVDDTQKLKEGTNYHVFWVTQNILSGVWQQLPLVTPEQVRTSRYIKRIFTGDLNRPVVSSPPFGAVEKYLLKAQLVRITHNCQIAPRGLYAPLQDNPDEIDFAQQFKMPEFGQLNNLQNWVHANPYILKLGRSSYYVDPKMGEEQKEEYLAKLGQNDPKIQRLKAINEDKGLEKFGLEGCWTVKAYGDTQIFNNVGKDEGTTSCYGVVALRNPHWPGWHTVASNKQYGSIYIGYGLKSSQPPFYPLEPSDIAVEAEDVDECHQPNPKDPPDELQPDSDDQNKKMEQ